MEGTTALVVDGSFFLHNWTREKQERILKTVLDGKDDDDDCNLFWNEFNAKEHVKQVKSHKAFIVRCYERFAAKCFPNLTEEQVMRHDDSKYSFVEVIGYTDRFVNGQMNSKCWTLALRHHYDSNSHHPEFYMEVDSSGFPSQRNMSVHDLEESVIDMLACQWERGCGGREDVQGSELVAFSDSFLDRYTPRDKLLVKEYLSRVAAF